MPYDPDRHHRRSIRLKGYDYALPGAYFVTLCTKDRTCFFGDVVDGLMRPGPIGAAAHACWVDLPHHFPQGVLDAFVVMPNHVHGILGITDRPGGAHPTVDDGTRRGDRSTVDDGTGGAVQLNGPTPNIVPTAGIPPDAPKRPSVDPYFSNLSPQRGTLSVIIRTYKGAVTRWCRINGYPAFGWQPRFYDHIIRNDKALARIRRYIADNPRRWSADREHPARGAPPSAY